MNAHIHVLFCLHVLFELVHDGVIFLEVNFWSTTALKLKKRQPSSILLLLSLLFGRRGTTEYSRTYDATQLVLLLRLKLKFVINFTRVVILEEELELIIPSFPIYSEY